MYASQDPNIPNMVKHRWHVWPSPMWRQCRDNSRVSVAWPHWATALWAPTPGRVSPLHTGKTINSSWIIHIAYRSFCHYQCQSEFRILCSDELSIIYYYVWHIFFSRKHGLCIVVVQEEEVCPALVAWHESPVSRPGAEFPRVLGTSAIVLERSAVELWLGTEPRALIGAQAGHVTAH